MRFRIKYSKGGQAVFLGHLEMLRLWQRAMRRAGLPLAYSHGFNPHPRLAFGPALAVGIESLAEYLDVELTAPLDILEVKERLQAQLPAGLQLLQVFTIPDQAPALTAIINAAAYRVTWEEPPNPKMLQEKAETFLSRPVVEVSRPGKEGARVKDIRPGVFQLDVKPEAALEMLLECSSRGVVRPEEVVGAMALEGPYRVIRTGLFIRRDDRLLTPEELVDPQFPVRGRKHSAFMRR
ncbi:TIGR03936 family radical SAM-associated protein [Moorella sp. ACPs]|uniref:TIGR03936 family radical SAM-associated protein n=1 Tax=Neomoorella carbonis TaxID=3062783 RepID=UPI0032442A20